VPQVSILRPGIPPKPIDRSSFHPSRVGNDETSSLTPARNLPAESTNIDKNVVLGTLLSVPETSEELQNSFRFIRGVIQSISSPQNQICCGSRSHEMSSSPGF